MKRAVVLLGALVSLAAGAYVLPGASILRRMVSARQEVGLSSIKVEGSLHFYGSAVREAGAALGNPLEQTELEADGALYLKPPGRCRLEASVPDGNTVAAIQSQGRNRTVGAAVAPLNVALEQVCALLSVGAGSPTEGRAEMERDLRELKVETRTTSLARFGGEVAYVLGELGEGKSQLWVYKENFEPARVRYQDARKTQWDVRFLDYNSPMTGEQLPRRVEVWRDGQRVMRFTALQADTRAKMADSLF